MFSDHTLILINLASIAFLLILLIVLVAATRMKNATGWVAMIIVTTTVPVYLGNLTRDLAVDYFLWFLMPAMTLNALCMPSLWLFTISSFDKTFTFKKIYFLHFIPAIVSLAANIIFYAPLSAEEIEAERAFMTAGGENLPAIINDIILFGQFFIYFIAIFTYIRKRKKYLQDNLSDSDYVEIKWIPRFLIVFFVLFFVVFVAYVINPRTDTWLIPILNVIGMAYLVYCVISSSATFLNQLAKTKNTSNERKEVQKIEEDYPTMNEEQMKEICDKIMEYLQNSKAYKNSEFNLSSLSIEIGIHRNKISSAINNHLQKNFFELINTLRVEEAKSLLLEHNHADYTVESIFTECGFRSRSTFFAAFKKIEKISPAQWLKSNLQ
jgi:AraC-like DNA-binding protein